jgi:hypothetical protein
MPDTGLPWEIPYAAPSDLVRDWPALSEDIAEAVADGLDDATTILQVVSSVYGTRTTTSNINDWTTIFSLNVTPKSATSDLIIIGHMVISLNNNGTAAGGTFDIQESGTTVIGTVSPSSRVTGFGKVELSGLNQAAYQARTQSGIAVVASTGTTLRTFDAAVYQNGDGGGIKINRSASDVDSASYLSGASSLVCFEVA